MKKLVFILALSAIVGGTYAQKKPKINQAEKARTEGNLGEAKDIIDQAIEYDKTKDDPKTWYYRGLIYASLDTTSNPEYKNLDNDPLKKAMDAFAKADELNEGNNDFYITNSQGLPVPKAQQIQTLWAYYLNKGVESFQADDAANAADWFEKTIVIQPKDTTGYIYAASAAQTAEEYDRAADHYYTLINDLNYKNKDTYNALIYIESRINEDSEKALEVVKQAKKDFPDDVDFSKTEINMLINMDKADEAKASLEAAIKQEPDNPDLLFTLGVVNDELGNKEEAVNSYRKALEVDPNHYNSVYNLAALKTNSALDLIKEKNNLGISSSDVAKAKKMEANIKSSLEEAIPLWEKANEIQPGDRRTLETMQYIYVQLKQNEKAAAISKKLDAMPEEK